MHSLNRNSWGPLRVLEMSLKWSLVDSEVDSDRQSSERRLPYSDFKKESCKFGSWRRSCRPLRSVVSEAHNRTDEEFRRSDRPPKSLLGCNQDCLVDRVGSDRQSNPLAAAVDDVRRHAFRLHQKVKPSSHSMTVSFATARFSKTCLLLCRR
jgi:hypothetical protein